MENYAFYESTISQCGESFHFWPGIPKKAESGKKAQKGPNREKRPKRRKR